MTVILGDWRDVLPGTYDPATAIVITDPPYGSGSIDLGYADDIPWSRSVRDVLDLLPAVRHVIRGPAPAWVARDYPAPRRLCVEVARTRRRAAFRPGSVVHTWQGWGVWGRLRVVRSGRIDSHIGIPYDDDGLGAPSTRLHRGLTPLDVSRWIVEAWTDPGLTVVDPYAGLGTIGRAARTLGHPYIGAEIDEVWHRRAVVLVDAVQTRYSMEGVTA